MPLEQPDLSAIRSQLNPEERALFDGWVAIGVGGLPHTLEGFRTLQILNKKLRDSFDLSRIVPRIGTASDSQGLNAMPPRPGARPTIAPFAIPHRQTDQLNSEAQRERQKSVFKAIVDENQRLVHYRKSYFEAHNDAVFLKNPETGNQAIVPTSHGEIGHVHPSDGSMHFSLSPSDTKEVLEKGWGELHGLAGQSYEKGRSLPATYVLVYAPRTEDELALIRQILQAAIQYSALGAASL